MVRSVQKMVFTLAALLLIWPGHAVGQARLLLPTNFDEPAQEKTGDNNGTDKDKGKEEDKPTWYSIHAQATFVTQGNWQFTSPYQGPHSFLSRQAYDTTVTGTVFLGARLWNGGEIYFNPEIAGGQGDSGAFGMGGFPNGEAVRTGLLEPTPYIARLFYRQILALGSETEKVEDAINQVAGERPVQRLVVSLGRIPSTDSFDNNAFSHDPAHAIPQLALMYNGAWIIPPTCAVTTMAAASNSSCNRGLCAMASSASRPSPTVRKSIRTLSTLTATSWSWKNVTISPTISAT